MAEQVTILGCGPAGLLAAHAAALEGYEPLIVSNKVKSRIGGAQFLHRPIPGIAEPIEAQLVLFQHRGTAEGYAKKVYNDVTRQTSWHDFNPGTHRVWNMRQAYDRLWESYERYIEDVHITPEFIGGMLAASPRHIVSTIPAIVICPDPQAWDWVSQDVWILYGEDLKTECGDMVILYSGDPHDIWYRQSSLFGWQGVEFSEPVPGAVKISKPLETNWPGNPKVHQLGRYGRWQKKVLIHDGFEGMLALLKSGMAEW